MSYVSGIDQRVIQQILYSNSSTVTYSNNETNSSLLASLKYVQDFTQYYIYKIYMVINNPIFSGLMTGDNINLSSSLSVPTIQNIINFTTYPTLQNQKIDYDILGEIKMVFNIIPPNYLLCDGSSYSTSSYQDLFNLIGYTYGGSDLTFNIPNFNSYFPIGANSQNNLGCPLSNFVTGNNEQGANNNYLVSSNFANNINSVTSLISKVPEHTHTITDNGHLHQSELAQNFNKYVGDDPEPVYLPICQLPSSIAPEVLDEIDFSFITINNNGYQIQGTDPISNLNGVNVSPPYTSVKYCICYKQN
jgi:microcystin-dependent protein